MRPPRLGAPRRGWPRGPWIRPRRTHPAGGRAGPGQLPAGV